MPLLRFAITLIILIFILPVAFQGPAMAVSTGSSGASTSGRSAGSSEAQTPGAGESVFGGGSQQPSGQRGGISFGTGSIGGTTPASTVSFTGEGGIDTGFGEPQFSGGQPFGTGDLQQDLYSGYTPAWSGVQSSMYGGSSAQANVYGGGYGATVGQAPVPGRGGAMQALGEPGEGATCLSTCTESYTPYECSTMYCSGK